MIRRSVSTMISVLRFVLMLLRVSLLLPGLNSLRYNERQFRDFRAINYHLCSSGETLARRDG
jgi:hypothetical protein